MRFFSSAVAASPMAYSQFLNSLDFILGPSQEIVIAGDVEEKITQEMIAVVHRAFLPNKILLLHPGGEGGNRLSALSSLVGDKKPVDGQPTAFLCEGYACKAPIKDPGALQTALQQGVPGNS